MRRISGSAQGMSPWTAAVAALLCSLLPGPPHALLLGPSAVSAATSSSSSSSSATAAAAAMETSAAVSSSSSSSCENTRLKCAFRTGCGRALQNYMLYCSPTLEQQQHQHGHGAAHAVCPEHCQHALIALTSTDEGKDLMTCQCGDSYCEETKQRVEVCRPHVEKATLDDSIVSCRLAQWICKADALCSTALDYYHRFCRSMFQGKRCSRRCMNSISILRRQEKAAKLISCRCDGRDEAECVATRDNMDRLCFPGDAPNGWGGGGAGHKNHTGFDEERPPPPAGDGSGRGSHSPPSDAAAPASAAPTTVAPCLVVLALLGAMRALLPHALNDVGQCAS